jgi:hypothetical protein
VPLLLLVVGGKQDEDLAVRAALRHPIESGFFGCEGKRPKGCFDGVLTADGAGRPRVCRIRTKRRRRRRREEELCAVCCVGEEVVDRWTQTQWIKVVLLI